MKKGLVYLAAAVLLAPGSLRAQSGSAARSGPGEGAAAPDRREMEEDVEIMRRLLNRSLSAWQVQEAEAARHEFAFSPDRRHLATRDGNTYKLWDVSTGRLIRQVPLKAASPAGFVPAEGVYLKGHGVVYTVTLPPTAHCLKTTTAKASPKPLSDWERARSELRGNPAEPASAHAPAPPSLADTVLRALAKNGHHFKHLGPNEKLTVVVTFRRPGQGPGGPASAASAALAQQGQPTGVVPAGGFSGSAATAQSGHAPQSQPMFSGSGRPASARDYELMGDLHLKQGRSGEAAQSYMKALELKPGGSGSAAVTTLNRKLAQAYLQFAESMQSPRRDEFVRRAIGLLERVAQETGAGQLAPAPLPGRLVVSVRKSVLEQAGSGKLPFAEFRQAAHVEFQPALSADKSPTHGK